MQGGYEGKELSNFTEYKYLELKNRYLSTNELKANKFFDSSFEGVKFSIYNKDYKGIIFKDCQFRKVEFSSDGTPSFKDCQFINCSFEDSKVCGVFNNCLFDNVSFKDCFFQLLRFINCEIKNMNWKNIFLGYHYSNKNISNLSFSSCEVKRFSAVDSKILGMITFEKMNPEHFNVIGKELFRCAIE